MLEKLKKGRLKKNKKVEQIKAECVDLIRRDMDLLETIILMYNKFIDNVDCIFEYMESVENDLVEFKELNVRDNEFFQSVLVSFLTLNTASERYYYSKNKGEKEIDI